MKIDSYKDIITSAKTTVLALFFGGLSGFVGILLCPFGSFYLSVTSIFGGSGLWLIVLGNKITLPISIALPVILLSFLAIHCAYALIIAHFHLKGVILVILIHYTSMIIALFVCPMLLDSSVNIWKDVQAYYYPIYRDTSAPYMSHAKLLVTVVSFMFFNGFLLSLLSEKVRKALVLWINTPPWDSISPNLKL